MKNEAPHVSQEQIEMVVAYLEANAFGRANALTGYKIVNALHLGRNGDRILRAVAHEATEQGILICTGNFGYCLPSSPEEAEETIGRLRSQGVEMIQRSNKLKALIDNHFHRLQTRMDI